MVITSTIAQTATPDPVYREGVRTADTPDAASADVTVNAADVADGD